jgi:hypothetical protein
MNLLTEKVMTCNGAFSPESPNSNDIIFNKIQLHRAELPAANGITNARTLARIYARLIGDVNENGEKKKRFVTKETLSQATISVTPPGEPDRVLFGIPSNFGKGGFQLYGNFFKALGTGVFGHKGKFYQIFYYRCFSFVC